MNGLINVLLVFKEIPGNGNKGPEARGGLPRQTVQDTCIEAQRKGSEQHKRNYIFNYMVWLSPPLYEEEEAGNLFQKHYPISYCVMCKCT